ncbi:L,D-transpeptidase family protein [Longimicrobium sp.]|uniref:L,D-transpeptidase family protein n=1 Tax=Longimicrobium sp. TaxID=2029185 RepID=UPI002E2FF739|nr:L,D-transpeptidase family protein [Longimicrobium sp.]HEX6041214.1 L,D-transpeptidase family protein [Longimicrobium sp.]
MRLLLALAITVPLSVAASHPSPRPSTPPGLDANGALQVIVSTTPDWNTVDATLQRYERDAVGAAWRPVGEPIPASVGRSGLGWGTGLHDDPRLDGPVKREGDGRAPAGIYRLSSAFGYAAAAEVPWIRLPYVQSDASIECVDDLRSRFYNRRVDRDTIAQPDWNSHEEMRRTDELYRWGVWVDHNSDPPAPGGGSCIFLHVWGGPGVATSGCTSMAEDKLRMVLAWLDPRARPALVQLPRDAYGALRTAWELP